MKWFWAILGLVVAALIGIFLLAGGNKTAPPANTQPLEVTAQDRTEGLATAKITLIEYGDFQCPACASFHPILEQLQKDYGNDLRFVFRHFPLTGIHPQAFPAARASEAAGLQGKFFEMHDLLYEKQDEWAGKANANDIFVGYAEQLNLDVDKFKSDLNAVAVTDHINADIASGRTLEVNSTPTFYLNGQKIEVRPQLEDFKAQIDEALKAN